MSKPYAQRHPLLRPGRWHLARPKSRALWTSATARELAELFGDPALRGQTEAFLRLVVDAVAGVETLLVFDDDCAQLEVAISARPDRGDRCAWDWVATSRRESPASQRRDSAAR